MFLNVVIEINVYNKLNIYGNMDNQLIKMKKTLYRMKLCRVFDYKFEINNPIVNIDCVCRSLRNRNF